MLEWMIYGQGCDGDDGGDGDDGCAGGTKGINGGQNNDKGGNDADKHGQSNTNANILGNETQGMQLEHVSKNKYDAAPAQPYNTDRTNLQSEKIDEGS